MVTTLGSTFCTTPASVSGGRWASAGTVPLPVLPNVVGAPPPYSANTYPSVPPSAPASSAVTTDTRNTNPRPRRGTRSGTSPSLGGPAPAGAGTTTVACAAGSRHGSDSASDHQGEDAPDRPSGGVGGTVTHLGS